MSTYSTYLSSVDVVQVVHISFNNIDRVFREATTFHKGISYNKYDLDFIGENLVIMNTFSPLVWHLHIRGYHIEPYIRRLVDTVKI